MTERPNLARLAGAAMAVLLLVGSACSGDDDAEPAATPETSAAKSAESAYHLLAPTAFADRLKQSPEHVINVHVPYEGEIAGTTAFVDFEQIKGDANLPADKTAPIVLYCRSGRMSKIAGDTLAADGYTGIYDLEGGMNAWEAAGNELIHDPLG